MPPTSDYQMALLDLANAGSPVIAFVADAVEGWPLTSISPSIAEATGHAVSDLLRASGGLTRYIHPDDRSAARGSLNHILSGGCHTAHFRLATAVGSYHWMYESARLTRQDGQEKIVGCLIDLTLASDDVLPRRDEELVRRVLDACPVPVRVTRLEDGQILYESPSSKEAYGGRIEDAPLNVLDHYVDPTDREDYVRQLKLHGRVEDYLVQFRRSDGRHYPGSVAARLIDFGGEPVVVSTTLDLTERQKHEQALREARETLEDAIESLSEGFAIWDADDRLVMCNSTYKRFNAVCADLLLPGLTWTELIRAGAERGQFKNAAGRVDKFVAEWAKERTQEDRNLEIQHEDGRWFFGSSYRTRQGGYVGIRIDITERKQMEQALRESESLVRRVLEASPVPITMNRVESGEVLYQSPAAKALYEGDRSPDQLAVLDRWADISQRKNYLDALLTTGAIDGWEIERNRHDGTRFWALESARLIDFSGEKVVVSSVLDLTERREKDAEIARQKEALHQSEKLSALGELLAGVSHELNNPLSVLVGQAQLLTETMSDPEVLHRAEKISEAANRCARIVKSFLSMARQEPTETRPMDINDVVTSALEVTAYALRSADIEVELLLADDLPPVMLDPDQFAQVVTNLLVNAQHALQEIERGRKLTVETRYFDHRGIVILTVTDNGPGISEDAQKRVFEPLFTTKEIGAGTGIGLAICHRIVSSHGGSLRVESKLGKGASFVISLPRSGRQASSQEAREHARKTAGRARVLVVDDEPEVAEVIAEILEHDGYDVDTAHSGEQALKAIARTDFDTILCDLRMPQMDGQALYRHLEQERPDLLQRLGFLTGDTLGQHARDFLRSVDCPFIEKPIMAEDIRDLVTAILDAA